MTPILQNPFPDTIADAWGEALDLSSLNSGASDQLRARIEGLAEQSRADGRPPRSRCVLLLGSAGSGKTHLFTRLRKKLGPRAVFFHTRPESGAEPTSRYLLAQLVDALRQPVPGTEHTQIEVVAGVMLSVVCGHSDRFPLTLVADPPEPPPVLIERALTMAEQRYPESSSRYLERLLRAAFERPGPLRRAMFTWLSGRPPSEPDLARLQETQGLGDEDMTSALKTLAFATAFGAPLVLVFDQLENLADDDPTRARLHAHGRLIADLRDSVHGMLLLQMAIDTEWTRFMRPALPPQFVDRMEETVLQLVSPTPEQARSLIEIHLDRIPPESRKGPFPWPLDPAAVASWTAERMTPRALLQRCKTAFDDLLTGRDSPAPESEEESAARLDRRLEVLWAGFVEQARSEVDRAGSEGRYLDAERIASGLLAALRLAGVPARRASGKKDRPEIRVTSPAPALILLAQQNHHISLAALLEAAQAEKGPVIVLREHAFAIPPTWKQVHSLIASLRENPSTAFFTLTRDDLVEWLAAESMLSAARSGDLLDDFGRSIPGPAVSAWLEKRTVQRRSDLLSRLGLSNTPVIEDAPASPPPAPPKPRRTPETPPVVPFAEADTGASEPEALEKLLLTQLHKLGVTASVTRRVIGARLIRIEVAAPRQRVAALDRAGPDIEHKLADLAVQFQREGPRRFFDAPRRAPRPVLLEDLLSSEESWLTERPGRFVVGEQLDGAVVKGDLSDGNSCHLLVAGQTGSGKSVLLRALLLSLARFHPSAHLQLTLGDPKRVTFGPLAATLAPYLSAPVCHDAESIVLRLEHLASRMDERYRLFEKAGVENLAEHNAIAVDKLPVEVIAIDEFADLMFDKAYKDPFLDAVKRIGGMGRAAGIHLILATQRPDRNAVPGDIKNNLVGKIALKVQSALNSRIILDEPGAEKLLGSGDLLANLGHGLLRAQAPLS
ncbi:MAG: FtsK/SpoIIIE domain-containing protein [Polyangiaceae bacterium]